MDAAGTSPDARPGGAASWYVSTNQSLEGDSVVVRAAGRLGHAAAPEFETALMAAADMGQQIQLDLAGVDYISSAGLAAIQKTAERLLTFNQPLVIRGAQGAVKLSFDLAGALTNVTVCD